MQQKSVVFESYDLLFFTLIWSKCVLLVYATYFWCVLWQMIDVLNVANTVQFHRRRKKLFWTYFNNYTNKVQIQLQNTITWSSEYQNTIRLFSHVFTWFKSRGHYSNEMCFFKYRLTKIMAIFTKLYSLFLTSKK